MSNADWLARYNARKNGQQPPPQAPQYPPQPQPYPQQPVYQPPPPQYPQGYGQQQLPMPPPQGPQPIPGAPAHAPFGYDQMTGQPAAPYGRDQYGNIIVQPVPQYYQPPPQQPMHDARGQVMPQGYGQPPYGVPGPPQWQPPVEYDQQGNAVIHALDAAMAYRGGVGIQNAQTCPECGGVLFDPTAYVEEGSRRLNTKTGEFATAAGHCTNCGWSPIMHPGATTMAMAGGAHGVGVRMEGDPRMAPGARNLTQTASQHGLPNLFAPKSA